jgi:hypothetical protein
LQVQLAVPDGPVQLWCVLGHAPASLHPVQPAAGDVHVSIPPVAHCFSPTVHALVQQIADPAVPSQVPFPHGVRADA